VAGNLDTFRTTGETGVGRQRVDARIAEHTSLMVGGNDGDLSDVQHAD
jgi:hypothetical protein